MEKQYRSPNRFCRLLSAVFLLLWLNSPSPTVIATDTVEWHGMLCIACNHTCIKLVTAKSKSESSPLSFGSNPSLTLPKHKSVQMYHTCQRRSRLLVKWDDKCRQMSSLESLLYLTREINYQQIYSTIFFTPQATSITSSQIKDITMITSK